MNAVVASGISSMSDSWISWNPRIDEPSKPSPASKSSASRARSGRLMCCQVPGRSTNLRSTISTPRSVANSRTSPAEVAPAVAAVCELSDVEVKPSFLLGIWLQGREPTCPRRGRLGRRVSGQAGEAQGPRRPAYPTCYTVDGAAGAGAPATSGEPAGNPSDGTSDGYTS